MRTKKALWLLVGLLLASLVVAGAACASQPRGDVVGDLSLIPGLFTRGISVTGEGRVTATPDLAILRLGIEAQDESVAQAQARARTAMDQVMEVLSRADVAEKDIQTAYFSIQPVYQWLKEEERQEVIGYRVTNMLQAKLRQIEDAGAIIDAVAEAGGDLTRVEGITFTLDDPSAYRDQAREEAIANAIAKAEQMARLTGVTLGRPVDMSEAGGYIPATEVRYAGEASVPVPASAPTPISAGELDITVTVSITFAIE